MAVPTVIPRLVPESVPYPIRGGFIRGIRTAVAFIFAGVVASVADGSLFNVVKVIPAEYVPFVTGALGVVFVSIDKYLREKGLIDQAAEDAAGLELGEAVPVDEDVPTTGPQTPTTGDVPADDPVADGVDPDAFDDPKDNV